MLHTADRRLHTAYRILPTPPQVLGYAHVGGSDGEGAAEMIFEMDVRHFATAEG